MLVELAPVGDDEGALFDLPLGDGSPECLISGHAVILKKPVEVFDLLGMGAFIPDIVSGGGLKIEVAFQMGRCRDLKVKNTEFQREFAEEPCSGKNFHLTFIKSGTTPRRHIDPDEKRQILRRGGFRTFFREQRVGIETFQCRIVGIFEIDKPHPAE